METLTLEDKLEILANKALKEITSLRNENELLQKEKSKFQQKKELACGKLKVLLDNVKQLKNDN
ncbi:MAG: hypothetical protein WC614_09500 [bacterium]